MSIQLVAKEAKVSVATVSRTFNNPQQVSDATRQRVEAAALKIGYLPNASARNLRTKNTRTLGVVIPTFTNPVFSEYLQGVAEMAASKGYSILPVTTSYQQDEELNATKRLIEFGVDGVILTVSNPDNSPALTLLKQLKIPYVLSYNWSAKHPCVSIDNQKASTELVQHLYALGHRNIAMVCGQLHASDRAAKRYEGFLQAITHFQIGLPQPLEVPFIDQAVETITLFLQQNPTISALVCSNDMIALRAIRAAHECKKAVPKDLSITGFDGIRLAQDLTPTLTTIAQPNMSFGEQSVQLLTDHLLHNVPLKASSSVLLPYSLEIAESSTSIS